MIIRCPNCTTGFKLPETALAKPRRVRCSRCGHSWVEHPLEDSEKPRAPVPSHIDESAPTVEPSSATEVPPLPAAPHERSFDNDASVLDNDASCTGDAHTTAESKGRSPWPFILLFMTVLGLIAALGFTHHHFSHQIASLQHRVAAPAVLNAPLSREVRVPELRIPMDEIERDLQETSPSVLTFTGVVENVSDEEVALPSVVVSLYDDYGNLVDSWPAYVEKTRLKPGARAKWICRFFDLDLSQVSEHSVRFEVTEPSL